MDDMTELEARTKDITDTFALVRKVHPGKLALDVVQ